MNISVSDLASLSEKKKERKKKQTLFFFFFWKGKEKKKQTPWTEKKTNINHTMEKEQCH